MQVTKRNGEIQPFDVSRIHSAVNKAFLSVTKGVMPDSLKSRIDSYFSQLAPRDDISVEEIQDMVENLIMEHRCFEVAKAYILYRNVHQEHRIIRERLDYMDRYAHSEENAATTSETDANANVSSKNIANLDGEVYKTLNRQIQRERMRKQLKKQFPELEEKYIEDLTGHIIYAHDEASFPTVKHYCMAGSLYSFMLHGSSGMDGLGAAAPRNLSSFCGQFGNLVFLHSAQCKGAVAYGEFFNVLEYYCTKDFGMDYQQHLNEFVYLGPKLRRLLRESGVWFDDIDSLKDYDFGDAGLNAIRDGLVIQATRPATEDELKTWIEAVKSNPDFELKLGDGTRTVKSQIHQAYQQIVYTINQPAGNRCYQSPFTNISYYDSQFWKALFEDFSYPDGTRPNWERVSFLQKDFMRWLNAERTKTLLTFPVETMALLTDGNDIVDKEYKDFTAEMYSEGHSFFTYISNNPNALASCCRLRNEITENVFSFTNGLTGVQTGSANVITLNHSRIIQDWARENGFGREYLKDHFFEHSDSYKAYLVKILSRVYKYHIAYKTMLYEMEDAKMLTSANEGFISMRKLFSTIGDNGINEAAEFVGLTCNYNDKYRKFCNIVTGTIFEQNKLNSTKEFLFNQEFVPAESLSSKNYNWDKEDGYWVPDDRILYNSYFYLADDRELSIIDKFKLHGREFTDSLDGGVGLHLNLVEQPSKSSCLKMLDIAVMNGTSYFTINVPNSECTNLSCHHIAKQPLKVCPICGSPMRQWTRIIGYLRPVDNFPRSRYEEARGRFYHNPVFDEKE